MARKLALFLAAIFFCATGTAATVATPKADAAPKPDTYLCPHATAGAVDCFLQATEHLYTMCRQVKSIEIIEFGYEKSDEGTNGAKTEYCVDKHRQSITRPYQSALREAAGSRAALEGLRALHEVWLISLVELKWRPGESDADYKLRVGKPYDVFRERAILVRAALPVTPAKPATKGKTTSAATPAPPKSTH
jgi:hypothetical protein